MSTFLVYRRKEYAVILADLLAYRQYGGTNKTSLRAPKLTHVAPCVFAAHAGNWQPAYEVLSNFHEYLLASPATRTFDEIAQYLEQEGNRCFQKWCKIQQVGILDIRIPIILTGPYRHPDDVSNGVSSTCLIVETANKFKPARGFGAYWAYDDEVTKVALALLELPAIKHWLNTGPLSLVQALRAIHSFIAEICTFVSPDRSIVIIGDEDEHTIIEGPMVSLPMKALGFG